MSKRGFEVISSYADKNIQLPKRATKHAAGYDFEAAEEIVLPAIWKTVVQSAGSHLAELFGSDKDEALEKKEQLLRPLLVPTGIKAYMQEDEYLQLTNRSSNPLKNFIVLPNGVGIVDADYYNNEGNEGHIYFQFLNFGLRDKVIRKGDRIGQGIFLQFLKADQDEAEGSERTGGFGSSGQA
ncbi:dCTP deaminase/dUTPase family protein [Trichococcus pasteurii]|uniref:dUTP diphosphatase n=1 Tax=Trichococcus pasteurii TaxID=43064 RepID=A0A1W1IG41_9LACT|nr:dUTP diphosphatase [Trichococcus pasteurii]SFE96300.1 dUTP pyrophosphatase [Trichococcus pasteurii]SLM51982.1 deoxyuridine triphosphate nucleotidohydrolase/deoxycytidine triphosphate deaminase [Trichococcus pasteurii]SSB92863.1 deoxyuridine triphosphate nucleotidohydrolase/deoxycytidine triphosphate deaminase [Trichococcus pasteurii]